MEENKDESMKELLKKIAENTNQLIERKEAKKWKLPFKGRVSKARVRKGWATVQIIRHNGNVDFVRVPTKDGTISVDGFPRVATVDYTLSHKGKPLLIIPEWSLEPYNPILQKDMTDKNQMGMSGRRLVLSKLEGEQIKAKPKIGGMIGWLILGAIILGGAYYLLKGGKLF